MAVGTKSIKKTNYTMAQVDTLRVLARQSEGKTAHWIAVARDCGSPGGQGVTLKALKKLKLARVVPGTTGGDKKWLITEAGREVWVGVEGDWK
ncbi:hypothetical protein [Nocardia sp. NPDC050435]|uniref:hypothetical protein n=1 Tax=Nocardia sp. NPDC050435 TaxID=3155040 RepID=UPI0033DADB38